MLLTVLELLELLELMVKHVGQSTSTNILVSIKLG